VRDFSKEAARADGQEHLERVGLGDQADSYPAELSGGQKQRVGIARALAMDPDLLLFDEPTSALDPELVGEVVSVMRDLADEGMTMLVVTHEMGFARSTATRLTFLDRGRVVERGDPTRLFDDPDHDRTAEFLRRLTDLHGGAG
jgi:polar amino acid transport system ATP-binding protein